MLPVTEISNNEIANSKIERYKHIISFMTDKFQELTICIILYFQLSQIHNEFQSESKFKSRNNSRESYNITDQHLKFRHVPCIFPPTGGSISRPPNFIAAGGRETPAREEEKIPLTGPFNSTPE